MNAEPTRKPGLLDRLAVVARGLCMSNNTIKTYSSWVWKFYIWNQKKPASQWTGRHVEGFLEWLDQERYSDRSRHQALCAIVFAFKRVMSIDVGTLDLPARPKEKKILKIIPSQNQITAIMRGLHGQNQLMAVLIYGAGTRVMETCQLRVQDIDFETMSVRVHSGKGDKDRLTVLPHILVEPLKRHIAKRAELHQRDLERGNGVVDMPNRLAIKYPSRQRELGWQFLFPSSVVHPDGKRWHITPESMQKAMRIAVRKAGILLAVTPHTLRHAFATHALRAGANPLTIMEQMGHEHLTTTQIYLHADNAPGFSPIDVEIPAPVARFSLPAPLRRLT